MANRVPVGRNPTFNRRKSAAWLLILALSAAALADDATLRVTGRRPALLWLVVEDIEGDNVTVPGAGNMPVTLEVLSDGSLDVSVKTNYAYVITITTDSGRFQILGPNTGLSWTSLRDGILPATTPGEPVSVTLDWESDEHPSDRNRAPRPVPGGPERDPSNR